MYLVDETFRLNYATYDQQGGLDVRFQVYDITDGTATFEAEINATEVGFGSYTAEYVGDENKIYLAIGMIYSGGNPDPNRAPSAECFLVGGTSIAAVKFGFAYAAYDQNETLDVTATVYEDEVQIDSFPLTHAALGVYFGIYEGTLTHNYDIVSVVDDDLLRAPACENFDSVSFYGVLNQVVSCEAVLVGQDIDATLEGECA